MKWQQEGWKAGLTRIEFVVLSAFSLFSPICHFQLFRPEGKLESAKATPPGQCANVDDLEAIDQFFHFGFFEIWKRTV